MFTGIVKEIGRVTAAPPGRLVVGAGDILGGLESGDSIAVNGVCLTVTSLDAGTFAVDIMGETASRSSLGRLAVGDEVNLEPPLTLGGKLGGHLVQGHVDGTGRVMKVARAGEMRLRVEALADIMRYVVEKGFIAVDGVSLTVASRDSTSFEVAVVDYTGRHTTIGSRRPGDTVNLEADIIGKYVEQLSGARGQRITAGYLAEHGFV
jgi:riboflavin synthase